MAGVAEGVVRPGEDNVAQGIEGGLEIFRVPRLTGAALEDGVAHDNATIVLENEGEHLVGVTRSVDHPQGVLADLHGVAVLEGAINVYRFGMGAAGAGVGVDGYVEALTHHVKCADVIGVGVGEEDGDGHALVEHLDEGLGLGAGIDEDALVGLGADEGVAVHGPGADLAGAEVETGRVVGHGDSLLIVECGMRIAEWNKCGLRIV